MNIIEEFRLQSLGNYSLSLQDKPDWGAWIISCVRHVFTYNATAFSDGTYSVP